MTSVRGRYRRVDVAPASAARRAPSRTAGDSQAEELLRRFPPRPSATTWSVARQPRDQITDLLLAPPFAPSSPNSAAYRRRVLTRILDWLSVQAGDTWQQRWMSSGADAAGNVGWRDLAVSWLRTQDGGFPDGYYWHLGGIVRAMVCADVIRPSLVWLTTPGSIRGLAREMARTRDPETFAELDALIDADEQRPAMKAAPLTKQQVLCRIATIIGAKGGMVADITVGDCLELLGVVAQDPGGRRRRTSMHFYQVLHALGVFPADAPVTVRKFYTHGQLSVERLIDRYDLACGPIRDLLVEYLRERQTRLDHSTLRNLAYQLGRLFWKDLEAHHPGIDRLKLPAKVAAAWKQRVLQDRGGLNCLTAVRAFYLDIAHWALEDPARWARWVAPCPIRHEDTSHAKERQHRKSRMDQRTRERMPLLPVLVAAVDRERTEAAERLTAAQAAAPGAEFMVAGQRLRRSILHRNAGARLWAEDPDSGQRRDLTLEEHRAFWTWASVEVLRHTGIRVEELTELSHHSFVQYTLPTTGELVPLLHIAPSKSDVERLLVIDPELADVLSAIVRRIRDTNGAVPLVVAYDRHERVWKPPMPLLFQRRLRQENRPIPEGAVRRLLRDALANNGVTDASGKPIVFAPHDLRRIFVTDAVMNGMPPHIAQLVCGHKDINTTMGYKAIYPDEAISGHRAFIARRRALRPSDEYRVPTDEEWDEFLGHFERRKVALGTCGRAFGTPCIHEHSCLRCPLLRPDPAQRPRMVQIHDNLLARIGEAKREGWLGEVEGLQVSLAAARQKLAHLDERAAHATIVNLGVPDFSDVTGRDITGKEQP